MRCAAQLLVTVLLIAYPAVACAVEKGQPRFSPDGAILASPEQNCTVVLWDGASGEKIAALYADEPPWPPLKQRACHVVLSFSPNGKLLATQRTYGPVILWDAQSVRKLATFGRTGDDGVSLTFSRDSRLILSVIKAEAINHKIARTNGITVWDVVTQKELLHVREDQKKEFNEVVLSPDGKTVMALAGSEVGSQLELSTDRYITDRVKLWDIQSGKELVTVKAGFAKFSPHGRFLLFRDFQGEAIWDIGASKGCALPIIRGPAYFSPDGTILIEGQDDCAVAWDLASGSKVGTFCAPQPSLEKQFASRWHNVRVSFSPDGKLLATQRINGPIILWNLQDGRQLATLTGAFDDAMELQFSLDSRLLLSVGEARSGLVPHPRMITVWDVATQKELFYADQGENEGFKEVSFSPDGKTIMAYIAERLKLAGEYCINGIRLWDIYRAEELATLEASSATSASFSPDGRLLLITDPALGARVLDIQAKKMSRIGHATSSQQARDISPDNVAESIGGNEWNWTIFIKGNKQNLDDIKCVEYKLHPTFPNPVRLVCEQGDPKRPFGLSARGWGTFPISIRVFMKDGKHRDLQHQLKF
ncbi:MAG: pYEATS domain-containing protein [Thermodesulfobacteriota bacterium]